MQDAKRQTVITFRPIEGEAANRLAKDPGLGQGQPKISSFNIRGASFAGRQHTLSAEPFPD